MNKITSSKIKVLCFVFILNGLCFFNANAQKSLQENYSKNPVWIQMMEDPAVNFYEAVKAYNEYWKNHEKPREMEEETMTDKEQMKKYKREHKRDGQVVLLSDKEKKELQDQEYIRYQNKRFKNWVLTVKPFVQEDGRILSQAEIDAIWQKQQLEISQQSK